MENRPGESGDAGASGQPVICPQCRARYVPRRPTAGRRVRCRHCGHVWRDLTGTSSQVAGALAGVLGQVGSTVLASMDHASTVGRLALGMARPPEAAPAQWVGRKLGRYEIKAVLGTGAMGYVYEAHDRDLDRKVALKVLPRKVSPEREPLGLKMFLQEARVAARLVHPNIVTIYEIGSEDGIYYFAMERVRGVTLHALVEERGPLPAAQVCYIAAQAARALAAGHESGVVHRDVKPGNIMIDTAGQVKLADFGLADVSGIEGIRELSEKTLGTPGWIAPEVARGEKATAASDIYGLGLVIYYAMTRQRLLVAASKEELVARQREAKSIRREDLPAAWPPRLRDIVAQCLQADPADRYHSAGVLAADLLRALTPNATDATLQLSDAAPAAFSARTAVPPWLGWAVLSALALVSLLLAAWYWLLQ